MNFEGAIGEMDLVERLVELSREHFTGAIRFEQDGIIKIVYFKGGDILGASTNDRKDAIDEILLRAGKISREHIKQALAKRQENETLGDALLNFGFITRKELTWARRVQVIGIIRSVRSWESGNFAIVPDYLPKREEGTLFPLQQIIVEFIVTEQDRQPFERAMDGGEAVFRKRFDFDEEFKKLDLNEEAGEIALQIDGRKSAADIAVATAKDAFNVYKLLEALRLLGLIEKGGAKEEPKEDLELAAAGVSDTADTWSTPPAPEPSPPMMFDEPAVPASETMPPRGGAPVAAMPHWGDKSPVEAPQHAAIPIPPPPQRKRTVATKLPVKRSRAPLYTLITLLVIGGAGYGGWMWWQQRSVVAPASSVPPASRPVLQETPPVVPTVTETTATETLPQPVASTTTPAAPAAARAAAASPQPTAISRLDQSPGGSMITNTPQPAAASDQTRERYDAMARQFAQNPTGNFTIQFELVCQPASVAKAINAGGANIWFVPTTYRGQACYRVFWGHFETREAAVQSLPQIPETLRGTTPVVIEVPKS